jgi:hypothetical protein
MLAAFIGGWELLLIGAVLCVMIGVPLLVLGIVVFMVRRQKQGTGDKREAVGKLEIRSSL